MKNPFSTCFRPALALAFSGLLLASCEPKHDPVTPTPPSGTGTNVYVINEGALNKSTASVTLLNKTTKAVTADIFLATNGRALGDVAQSMTIYNNYGYLVVNNSNKIEVVTLPDFKSVATINGLVQPRYMVTAGTKGYVTEWLSATAGRVSVIDLTTNTITGTIPTGRNPEKLVYSNGTIYVPDSDENTVDIIDASRDNVTGAVLVADGPSSLVADKNDNVWILCGGITRYGGAPNYPVLSSTPGALFRMKSGGLPVPQVRLPFATGDSPSKLRISPAGDQLYYTLNGSEYRMDVTATALPTTPLIRRNFSKLTAFYGFDIDPKDNTLYVLDASFSAASKLIRYRADGMAIDSFSTGIGSNGAAFY